MYVLETSELNEILADYGLGFICEMDADFEEILEIELMEGELC